MSQVYEDTYQIEPSVLAFCHGKWNGKKFIKSEPSDILACCKKRCDNFYIGCMEENNDNIFCKKNNIACLDGCFLYNFAEDHYIQDCIEEICPTFNKECIKKKNSEIIECCKSNCPTGECCKDILLDRSYENYEKKEKRDNLKIFILFLFFAIFLIGIFFLL